MAKPTENPTWAETGTVVEPSAPKKASGWSGPGEEPPYQFFNWWQRAVARWLTYFETTTDAFAGYLAQYGAIVVDPVRGLTGANIYANTAAGFQAAISALSVGDRILVLDSIVLDALVQVTRNNMEIEFHPRVTMSKSGIPTGIRVSANGVRLKGGRMSGFSTAGDIGILIDAGSDYTMVSEMRFAACDTDISDLNGKGELWANINE